MLTWGLINKPRPGLKWNTYSSSQSTKVDQLVLGVTVSQEKALVGDGCRRI